MASKFAKRHYETIARAIHDAGQSCDPDQQRGVARVRDHLIGVFAADNAKFKRSRFVHACGLDDAAERRRAA